MKKNFLVELTIEDVRQLFKTEVAALIKSVNQKEPKIVQEDELLSLEQTCKFLHFAKPTVYAYVAKRKIPFIKKGRKLLFSKQQLILWLKESYKKTEKELKQEAESYILNKEGGSSC
jgi:excisionase family DNA binding protein